MIMGVPMSEIDFLNFVFLGRARHVTHALLFLYVTEHLLRIGMFSMFTHAHAHSCQVISARGSIEDAQALQLDGVRFAPAERFCIANLENPARHVDGLTRSAHERPGRLRLFGSHGASSMSSKM